MATLPPADEDKVFNGVVIPKKLVPYFDLLFQQRADQTETELEFISRALVDYGFSVYAQMQAKAIETTKQQEMIAEQQALIEELNQLKGE